MESIGKDNLMHYDLFCILLGSYHMGLVKKKIDINKKYVVIPEDKLVKRIGERHTGISKSDLQRIFQGYYIPIPNKESYIIKASILLDMFNAGNKNCKYVFVEDDNSRAIDDIDN